MVYLQVSRKPVQASARVTVGLTLERDSLLNALLQSPLSFCLALNLDALFTVSVQGQYRGGGRCESDHESVY